MSRSSSQSSPSFASSPAPLIPSPHYRPPSTSPSDASGSALSATQQAQYYYTHAASSPTALAVAVATGLSVNTTASVNCSSVCSATWQWGNQGPYSGALSPVMVTAHAPSHAISVPAATSAAISASYYYQNREPQEQIVVDEATERIRVGVEPDDGYEATSETEDNHTTRGNVASTSTAVGCVGSSYENDAAASVTHSWTVRDGRSAITGGVPRSLPPLRHGFRHIPSSSTSSSGSSTYASSNGVALSNDTVESAHVSAFRHRRGGSTVASVGSSLPPTPTSSASASAFRVRSTGSTSASSNRTRPHSREPTEITQQLQSLRINGGNHSSGTGGNTQQ
jgi:hypothetical protein